MQPDTEQIQVEVQYAVAGSEIPRRADFVRWINAAVEGQRAHGEVVVRIVDEAESQRLNQTYRGKPSPTNVLSFPFQAPPGVPAGLIGDLVICAPVVEREAAEQHKPSPAHWAHMTVHGVLHLLGYDHEAEPEAAAMEALETRILNGLGFAAPYDASD